MLTAAKLIDEQVITQLVQDIGIENTRLFIAALKDEFTLRKGTIAAALAARSHQELASEAHAFKGMAQTYGASPLAALLSRLEALRAGL